MKVYVAHNGKLYRLSEAKWMRVLRTVARSGLPPDMVALARPLGEYTAIPTARTVATDMLREVYRQRARTARGRLGLPDANGKLRWTRLAPGDYHTRAADGTEIEVYRIGRDLSGAVCWGVYLNGEDMPTGTDSLTKVEAQRRAQKLADDRRKPKQGKKVRVPKP
jgi:hypothetical protein